MAVAPPVVAPVVSVVVEAVWVWVHLRMLEMVVMTQGAAPRLQSVRLRSGCAGTAKLRRCITCARRERSGGMRGALVDGGDQGVDCT